MGGAGVPYRGYWFWAGKIMWGKAGRMDEKKRGQKLPTGPADFSVYQMFTIYPLLGAFLGRFHYNGYTPFS